MMESISTPPPDALAAVLPPVAPGDLKLTVGVDVKVDVVDVIGLAPDELGAERVMDKGSAITNGGDLATA
jgi:hypothetical protein